MGACQSTVDVDANQSQAKVDLQPLSATDEVPITMVPMRNSVCPAVNPDTLFKAKVSDEKTSRQHHVMSWLQWAPEPDSPCYQALHKHFPGSVPGPAVHYRLRNILAAEKYGFKPENTLLGTSFCPDEINNEVGDLLDLMKNHWGHYFPLGGISGAPFVGSTGFKAFSHHVPDNGDIILIYGPHVGISNKGDIGQCLREGQGGLSTSCGAVVGAYNACCAKKTGPADEEFDENDMQMAWIKNQLAPHAQRIKACPVPLAALAYQAYEMVNAKMERIVNNDFGSGRLVLVGGLQINMPRPYNDHFLPLKFEIRQKGKAPQDLLDMFNFNEEPAGNQDDKFIGA